MTPRTEPVAPGAPGMPSASLPTPPIRTTGLTAGLAILRAALDAYRAAADRAVTMNAHPARRVLAALPAEPAATAMAIDPPRAAPGGWLAEALRRHPYRHAPRP